MKPTSSVTAHRSCVLNHGAYLVFRVYKLLVSPLLGNRCCFHPTCSAYALEAIKGHGFIFGSLLTLKRLSRCHPLSQCGDDPVPAPK